MDIWSAIKDLNEAQAALNTSIGSQGYVQPWDYCGDVNLHHGGTAVRVDRNLGYAHVVEVTDLASATGQEGCVLIDKGTVGLSWRLSDRRRMRSALASFGWNASDLLQFDRARRANELARALWVYGARDSDSTVIRYEPEEYPEDRGANGKGYMEPDETIDGKAALVDRFMEELG